MTSKVMVFKIPVEMDEELNQIAELEDRSKAWLIRYALKEFLIKIGDKNGTGDDNKRV